MRWTRGRTKRLNDQLIARACLASRVWQDGDNPRQAIPIQDPRNFQAQMRAALRVGMPQWAMAQPLNQLQLRAITRLEQGFELRMSQEVSSDPAAARARDARDGREITRSRREAANGASAAASRGRRGSQLPSSKRGFMQARDACLPRSRAHHSAPVGTHTLTPHHLSSMAAHGTVGPTN